MKLPKYKCKICGKNVKPFTESTHLEKEHNIKTNKISDLTRSYESIH